MYLTRRNGRYYFEWKKPDKICCLIPYRKKKSLVARSREWWPTEQRWKEGTPTAEEGTCGVTEIFHILVMILVAPFIGFLVVQMIKNPPAVQETWVRSLGWKDTQ